MNKMQLSEAIPPPRNINGELAYFLDRHRGVVLLCTATAALVGIPPRRVRIDDVILLVWERNHCPCPPICSSVYSPCRVLCSWAACSRCRSNTHALHLGPLPQCPFKADFHLCWAQVYFRSPATSPSRPAGLPQTFPSSRPQTCAALTLQDVGHHSFVPHGPGRPPGCRIQHGASVACTIGTKPVYLQGPSIVQVA